MSMTIDDARLIRSFKSGDPSAFETVVTRYRPELLRHARRRVHDDGTAEDLVQETLVRAYRGFDRLHDDSRVRPWLHQILTNVCIDEANRSRKEHDKTSRAALDPSLSPTDSSIEDQLGLDTDASSLGRALARLPDTHRDALTMRFVDELDYDEIAEQTGVTETNARARVSRARLAVRRALQGVAGILVAGYAFVRRSARTVSAATSAPDSAGAAAGASSAGHAGRIATTLGPAIEAANSVAVSGQTTMPLLAKAAVGVGAVAAVALSAGPEQPVERPVAVIVEAEQAPPLADPPMSLVEPIVEATSAAPPAGVVTEAAPAAAPLLASAPAAIAPSTTAAPTTTVAPRALVLAAQAPAASATTVPATTVPATTVPATTTPATTAPPTTTVTTTLAPPPPLAGGSLQGSLSVTPAGPRLDLNGGVTLTVAKVPASGSLSGRLGVEAPDAAGSRRINGTLTLQLESGTVELRLAGYGTSGETPIEGTAPTSMAFSGAYRATGTSGQLATSGSFNGSLSGGTLSLALSP